MSSKRPQEGDLERSEPIIPLELDYQPKLSNPVDNSPEDHINRDPKVLARLEQYMDELSALTPKRSSLLEELGPHISSIEDALQRGYREETGRDDAFQIEYLFLDDPNAFILPSIDRIVISHELLRFCVLRARDPETGLLNLSKLQGMFAILGHEMGHKFLGFYHTNEKQAQGSPLDKKISDIESMGEERAYMLSCEAECDRFAVRLLDRAGLPAQYAIEGLKVLEEYVRWEESERRKKWQRILYLQSRNQISQGLHGRLEDAESIDEYATSEPEKKIKDDEDDPYGIMDEFDGQDPEEDTDADQLFGSRDDEREEAETTIEQLKTTTPFELCRRIERNQPSLASTHPDLGMRLKGLESYIASYIGELTDDSHCELVQFPQSALPQVPEHMVHPMIAPAEPKKVSPVDFTRAGTRRAIQTAFILLNIRTTVRPPASAYSIEIDFNNARPPETEFEKIDFAQNALDICRGGNELIPAALSLAFPCEAEKDVESTVSDYLELVSFCNAVSRLEERVMVDIIRALDGTLEKSKFLALINEYFPVDHPFHKKVKELFSGVTCVDMPMEMHTEIMEMLPSVDELEAILAELKSSETKGVLLPELNPLRNKRFLLLASAVLFAEESQKKNIVTRAALTPERVQELVMKEKDLSEVEGAVASIWLSRNFLAIYGIENANVDGWVVDPGNMNKFSLVLTTMIPIVLRVARVWQAWGKEGSRKLPARKKPISSITPADAKAVALVDARAINKLKHYIRQRYNTAADLESLLGGIPSSPDFWGDTDRDQLDPIDIAQANLALLTYRRRVADMITDRVLELATASGQPLITIQEFCAVAGEVSSPIVDSLSVNDMYREVLSSIEYEPEDIIDCAKAVQKYLSIKGKHASATAWFPIPLADLGTKVFNENGLEDLFDLVVFLEHFVDHELAHKQLILRRWARNRYERGLRFTTEGLFELLESASQQLQAKSYAELFEFIRTLTRLDVCQEITGVSGRSRSKIQQYIDQDHTLTYE